MGINNPGSNSVYHGVQTQFSNSIVNGIDVFTGGNIPISGQYVPENGIVGYVAEDGISPYVVE